MILAATQRQGRQFAPDWLEAGLEAVAKAKVVVLGDFCLDAYWTVEPGESELSVETGLPIRRVTAQRYSPGGAGNVAMNLKALGVPEVRCVGLLGEDFFGTQLIQLLKTAGIGTGNLLRTGEFWQTPVYAKPYCDGQELNRFDFGTANRLTTLQATRLLAALETAVADATAVIINQQLAASYLSPEMIVGINALMARCPQVLLLVDSRDHAVEFTGAVLKINAYEAGRLAGKKASLHRVIHPSEARADALALSAKTGRPVFVTMGAQGIIAANAARVHEIQGIQILGKTDPVGAGDTVVATLAAVLGCSEDIAAAGASGQPRGFGHRAQIAHHGHRHPG